jgi:exodeoxyribonuclease VII small subunit
MAEPGFEAALAALEERVKRLEAGDTPIDEALKVFEEGVRLASQCHTFLDEAEQRIAALSRGSGGVESTPLDEPHAR